MTATGAQIAASALTWLGTPFHHQGRVRNVGVDCIGVVIGVARDLGLSDYDVTGYWHLPWGLTLLQELRRHLVAVPIADVRMGDVLLFAFNGSPQHVGICTGLDPLRMAHAYAPMRKTVESPLTGEWLEQMRGAFRFPELV